MTEQTALDLLMQRLQQLHDRKHSIEQKIKQVRRLIYNRKVGGSRVQHWNQFFSEELKTCTWCGTEPEVFVGTLCYGCSREFDLSLVDENG